MLRHVDERNRPVPPPEAALPTTVPTEWEPLS